MHDDDIPVGRLLSRKAMLMFLGGSGITAIAGCGGGGTTTTATTRNATATVSIVWPSTGRLIPVAASSITVAFLLNGAVVSSQIVARPSSGNTSTVTFTGLPAGSLTVQAAA